MKRAIVLAALVLVATVPSPADAAPSITFSCTPGPASCKGWYRQPVTVHWEWLPTTASVVAGCNSNDPVDFDTASTTRFCKVSDGVAVTVEVPLSVDMTAPVVTRATPSRPPDANGWYRSPVQVSFAGTDALSGVAGCSSGTYSGPDALSADVLGRCWDKAGNVSEWTAFGLRYDATPPAITKVSSATGDRVIRLKWSVEGATAVEVWRSPGKAGASQSLLDTRAGGSVYDRDLRNGRRYDYRVRAVDAAGNAMTKTFSLVPGRRLIAPANRAQLTAPPLLQWTAVKRARYYNVQLFRNGRKILSVWPGRARYQLERSWRYGGKRRRLKPGTYRWMVWPGRGPRSESDYGPMIGRRSFTIAP